MAIIVVVATAAARTARGLPGAMAPACVTPGRSCTRRGLADHSAGWDSCSSRPQASVPSR